MATTNEEVLIVVQTMFKGIKELNKHAKNLNKQFGTLNRHTKNVAKAQRQMGQEMRKARLGMWSTIFAMRMLNQMFMSLLQPALQASGLFDLISTTLLVLFLPAVIWLLKLLLPLLEWFMSISEPVKIFIGVFVILMAIITAVAAVVILFVAILSGPIVGGIAAAVASVFAFIAVIWILIKVFSLIWDGIKWVFDWILNKVLKPAATWFKTYIYDPVVIWIKKAVDYIKTMFQTIGDDIYAVLVEPILSGMTWMINGMIDIVNKGIGMINDLLKSEWVQWAADKLGITVPTLPTISRIGETPTTQNNTSTFAPTVNVNASSNVDVTRIAGQLDQKWSQDYYRLTRGT